MTWHGTLLHHVTGGDVGVAVLDPDGAVAADGVLRGEAGHAEVGKGPNRQLHEFVQFEARP